VAASFPWPPRSPDLTPLDFSFWHELRQRVLAEKHDTEASLIKCIHTHVSALKDFAQVACIGVKARIEKCLEVYGENVDK